jgi:hypothetical protein
MTSPKPPMCRKNAKSGRSRACILHCAAASVTVLACSVRRMHFSFLRRCTRRAPVAQRCRNQPGLLTDRSLDHRASFLGWAAEEFAGEALDALINRRRSRGCRPDPARWLWRCGRGRAPVRWRHDAPHTHWPTLTAAARPAMATKLDGPRARRICLIPRRFGCILVLAAIAATGRPFDSPFCIARVDRLVSLGACA